MNDTDRQTILNLPSVQTKIKEIGYAECANKPIGEDEQDD